MSTLTLISSSIVALLHFMFLYTESIGWPKMARRFGYTKEETKITQLLATNQGAYNGGFAVLLLWALYSGHAPTVGALLMFIIAMSVVGAATVRWTIFVIQGVPAILALAFHQFS